MLPAAGLQAWERPDSDNKQHLAPLTSASFGSGLVASFLLTCFPSVSLCEWRTHRRGGQPGRGSQLWLARSRRVYLGKPYHNKLQPGIAPEDRGHHRCGAFHPNNGGKCCDGGGGGGSCTAEFTEQQLPPQLRGKKCNADVNWMDGSRSHTYSCCTVVHPCSLSGEWVPLFNLPVEWEHRGAVIQNHCFMSP